MEEKKEGGKVELDAPRQARHTRQKKSTKPVTEHVPETPMRPGPTAYRSLAEMPQNACRWPENDPRTDGFHMCGREIETRGSAYCDYHRKRSLDVARDKRRNKAK